MLAFVIRHDSWNSARIFLGPDAKERATTFMFEYEARWRNEDTAEPTTLTRAEFDQMLEDGELDSWDVFTDAIFDNEDIGRTVV